MPRHQVVSHEKWITARKRFLEQEKALSHQRERLAKARRALPWEKAKDYAFDGPKGKRTLAQLFAGRGQLVVFHFMFDPAWKEGCKICSFWADSFDRNVVHLAHRDVTLVAVSRAPLARLQAYRKRMGWTFDWYSSLHSDFNFDYQVSSTPAERKKGVAVYNYAKGRAMGETPGISVFTRDAKGTVFHTYSTYARGLDLMNAAYQYLDLVPRGRDEEGLSWPMAWVRRHDAYA